MQSNKYKFIGVIDSFDIFPNFVRPVFKKEEKYYFQSGKQGIICNFKEISKEIHAKILELSCIGIKTNIDIKDSYAIGDDPIICFRIDKNVYFISDINKAVSFVKNYDTEDEMLREEIDFFLDGVNRKNNQKKRMKQKV